MFCVTILIPFKILKIVRFLQKNRRVIFINIEIKKHNKFKDFFHRQYNHLEDILFSIIQKLPERFIPAFLMNWLDRHITKRINQLRHEQVKNTWKNMYLQNAATEIRKKEKAPHED